MYGYWSQRPINIFIGMTFAYHHLLVCTKTEVPSTRTSRRDDSGAEGQSAKWLSATSAQDPGSERRRLRDGEREAILAIPPAVRPVVDRVQPTTIVVAIRAEKTRIATGVLDRLMHDDEPNQAHDFDLLVRKLLADEAGNLGVGLLPLALARFRPDLAGDPVVVREERALQDGDLGGHARGGLEGARGEHALGVLVEAEDLAQQKSDREGPCGPVGGDGEVDDPFGFTPGAGWNREGQFATKESLCGGFAAHLVDESL